MRELIFFYFISVPRMDLIPQVDTGYQFLENMSTNYKSIGYVCWSKEFVSSYGLFLLEIQS